MDARVDYKALAARIRTARKKTSMPPSIQMSLSEIALLEQGRFNLSLEAYLSICDWIRATPSVFIKKLAEMDRQHSEESSLAYDYIEELEGNIVRLAAMNAGKLKEYDEIVNAIASSPVASIPDELTSEDAWEIYQNLAKRLHRERLVAELLVELSQSAENESIRTVLLFSAGRNWSRYRSNGGIEKAGEIAKSLLGKEELAVYYHQSELQEDLDEAIEAAEIEEDEEHFEDDFLEEYEDEDA